MGIKINSADDKIHLWSIYQVYLYKSIYTKAKGYDFTLEVINMEYSLANNLAGLFQEYIPIGETSWVV